MSVGRVGATFSKKFDIIYGRPLIQGGLCTQVERKFELILFELITNAQFEQKNCTNLKKPVSDSASSFLSRLSKAGHKRGTGDSETE